MTEQSFDFVDGDNRKQRIRAFLKRPIHQGGILLVAGLRGMGKTRLVDEALNERRPIFSWFNPRSWGGNSHNSRWSELRKPRELRRYIIKVDVDPFFPTKHIIQAAGGNENSVIPYDKDELAFQLIRNIVFGLTSTIDPRLWTRTQGKNLCCVLGFWRFWLAPNSLLLPKSSNPALLALSTLLFIGYFYWFHWFYKLHFGYSASVDWVPIFVSYVAALVLSCGFLRWLDWRAVINKSELLYNLVNAHDTEETNRRESRRETKIPFKWLLPVIIGLLAAGTAILLFPEHIHGLLSKIEKLGASKKEWLIATVSSGGGLIMAWTFVRRHESITHFNNKNPVWMITLLRSYLFLLHRCGIEPVLVFDELDKLAVLQQAAKKHKQDRLASHVKDLIHLKDELATGLSTTIEPIQALNELGKQGVLQQRHESENLSALINALLRLKHALGTEFLWILVGGADLHEKLRHDRHNRDALGPLATLVQQDIVLGPMSLKMAEEALEKSSRPLAALWLRSHGNFSTLVRERPQTDDKNISLLSEDDNKAQSLALLVNEIWEPDKYADYIDTGSMGGRYHLFDDWNQTWIHTGMLELANTLVTDSLGKEILTADYLERLWQIELDDYFKENDPSYAPGVYDPRTDNSATALQVGTSKVLIALGKFILFRHLQREGKIQTGANGAVKFKP